MPQVLSTARLMAHSAFALPLAMAALPLYVQLPKFYGDLGLSLATVGAVLLAARALDAVQDPLLGLWCDRLRGRLGGRRLFVLAAAPLLAIGLWGLFHPPAADEWRVPLLVLLLVIVHLGFSMGSIGYQAWGAQLGGGVHERTRITAFRETATLIGVIVASILPSVLGADAQEQMANFAWLYLAIAAVGAGITLAFTPVPRDVRPRARTAAPPFRAADLFAPLRQAAFRRLLAVFMLSGIAAAIPSTLLLFFVADVLRAESATPLFLGAYFFAGALSMPFWVMLAHRAGKQAAWLISMALAVAAFVWAYFLGAGDNAAFVAICIASGAALGADLALPASLLADVIDEADARGAEGAYFGLWNLAAKANLALAAGIALPLVSLLGYVSGAAGEGRDALAAVYCLLPCGFKLAGAALLHYRSPVVRLSRSSA